MNCSDCFFQSGRGYLDVDRDLPNMPDDVKPWQIVRVNDGNDSNIHRDLVLYATARYPLRFYNTASAEDLVGYGEPVVLTVNRGRQTDVGWLYIEKPPVNLMFVRIRTNLWNREEVVRPAVEYYTSKGVPVVLTFMAYHKESAIPEGYRCYYGYRKRTSNPYWAIDRGSWRIAMTEFRNDPLVYSCGREGLTTACSRCGNCVREFMRTKERIG